MRTKTWRLPNIDQRRLYFTFHLHNRDENTQMPPSGFDTLKNFKIRIVKRINSKKTNETYRKIRPSSKRIRFHVRCSPTWNLHICFPIHVYFPGSNAPSTSTMIIIYLVYDGHWFRTWIYRFAIKPRLYGRHVRAPRQ